jgi:hypothetical protein
MIRNFSKRIASSVAAIVLLVGAIACSGPRVIPDNILKDIIHDAYLANAYLEEANINDDSLYIYEPIFERYGYTIEDMQHTIMGFSERKSAMLSDLMYEVNQRLSEESKVEQRKIVVLDTIDNIAKREYTRTVYSDSLIRVKHLRDSSKLRITITDLVPAEYTVSFTYLIDTLDENRNSRVEAYLINRDSDQLMRHTMMLSRYRESKYTRKFTTDTIHRELYINMFYHPRTEEAKEPDITITDFKVVRVLPTEHSVDSLYRRQLDIRLFNHDLMTSFTHDTVDVAEAEIDTIATESLHYEKDSLTLRTN